jgi:hypothetical protein
MLKTLKNVLGLGEEAAVSAVAPVTTSGAGPASEIADPSHISQWASMQGLKFAERRQGRHYELQGKIGDKRWGLEQGQPSRDFIAGLELRARAALGVRDEVVILIMTRQLKKDLDQRAFALYTDSVQTVVNPNLPEEMRWLETYEEVGWEALGKPFINNYAILAEDRQTAQAWVTKELVDLLLAWPTMDPASPKILMIKQGNAYLRMQHTEGDMPMLEHATMVFTTACELALSGLTTDLPL